MSSKYMIWLDANSYLRLYETAKGRPTLESIEEHQDYIFITQQIVNEVQRRKQGATLKFLSEYFGKDDLPEEMPDLLLGFSKDELRAYRREKARDSTEPDKNIVSILRRLAIPKVLSQVNKSQDLISVGLNPLFERAVRPTPDEIASARLRKETGNPPGKAGQPLGDELNWEQLLTHIQGVEKLWIITGDEDFVLTIDGRLHLHASLDAELSAAAHHYNGKPLEVFLFKMPLEGIRHFSNRTGIVAGQMPSEKEQQWIEEEHRSYEPLYYWKQPLSSKGVQTAKSMLKLFQLIAEASGESPCGAPMLLEALAVSIARQQDGKERKDKLLDDDEPLKPETADALTKLFSVAKDLIEKANPEIVQAYKQASENPPEQAGAKKTAT